MSTNSESKYRLDALFLSPHPDDVELFAGGTVARLVEEGRSVMIADLSAGELASNGDPVERRRESLAAAKALGVEGERPVLGLPDGGIQAADEEQCLTLVSLIRRVRPRLLVAPFPQDRHPDHVQAGELARRAFFLAGIGKYPGSQSPQSLAAFRPGRLLFYPCHLPGREAEMLVDIGGQMSRWEAALRCYASQFGEGGQETYINRPSFLEAQRGRRARWGQLAGCDHAEAFFADGPIRVDDLLHGLLS